MALIILWLFLQSNGEADISALWKDFARNLLHMLKPALNEVVIHFMWQVQILICLALHDKRSAIVLIAR